MEKKKKKKNACGCKVSIRMGEQRGTVCMCMAIAWLLIAWPPCFMQAVARAPGGRREAPAGDKDVHLLEDLAKYAVAQYNFKQGSDLEYVRLVSSEQQVVAGIMYYLVLEASSGGHTKFYEAKVWVKVWENFKSLEGFKQIQRSSLPTTYF